MLHTNTCTKEQKPGTKQHAQHKYTCVLLVLPTKDNVTKQIKKYSTHKLNNLSDQLQLTKKLVKKVISSPSYFCVSCIISSLVYVTMMYTIFMFCAALLRYGSVE